MTLDEMYTECATNIGETISKSSGAYTGDSLIIVNQFKSAINYIYRKIAREKYFMAYNEDIVLDSDLEFSLSSLTKTFCELITMENSNEQEIVWERRPNEKIRCPNEDSGDSITVFYHYVPEKLSAYTDTPTIPEGVVDFDLYINFASGKYLKSNDENPNRANFFWDLFNDGYDNIRSNIGETDTVMDVYGGDFNGY